MSYLRITSLALSISMISGCATMDNSTRDVAARYGMAFSCVAGGVAGALIGAWIVGDGTGAAAGATVGTALGCYAGSVWQNRAQNLQKIAQEENLAISVEALKVSDATGKRSGTQEAGLIAQVDDAGMFPVGSDKLTADGQRQISKLAAAFAHVPEDAKAGNDERRLLVVGHTDATGDASFNQKLSEKRARTVGRVLAASGIPTERIYFQGAGASRPVADNNDANARSKNRRVEIVEVANQQVLAQRVNSEQANAKYLAFGTSTEPAPLAKRVAKPGQVKASPPAASSTKTPAAVSEAVKVEAAPAVTTVASKPMAKTTAIVDFGGAAAANQDWPLARIITPKSSGFSFISTAQATSLPAMSCQADKPRVSGAVISLASSKPLETHVTRDYLPGYNNVVWANVVNGHLVTISPVSILRDNAAVDRQPFLQVVPNYDQNSKNTALKPIYATANTFEGEKHVLYRVFTKESNMAVSCLDIVFEKGNAKAVAGKLFYPEGTESFVAEFVPIRS